MSSTVPPSVDVIQSQQIATLIAQTAALQTAVASATASASEIAALSAKIDALQSQVDDINHQLDVGPPKFGVWEISGAGDSVGEINSVIDNILKQP
jgi:hypothetical protein